MRYAAYRADADLQRLHQLFPVIAMWDDHESANDAWEGGAQNHQPDTEGQWSERKRAAMRAYREWMPVSDDAWEDYDIGDLATLFRPETRLTARSQPLGYAALSRGQSDRAATLAAFRDGAWRDEARTMLGGEQEAWLAGALRRSTGRGARWQVLAQQTIMGSLAMPPEAAGWLRPEDSDSRRGFYRNLIEAGQAGLPFGLDSWDGFPAARRRLLRSALDANANLIVLAGDSHNAWGFDLDLEGARRSRVRRAERDLAGLRERASPRAPGRNRARKHRPQPATQVRRDEPARLSDAAANSGARDRRMAVPGHGSPALDAARRAARDERPAREQSVRLGVEPPKRRLK